MKLQNKYSRCNKIFKSLQLKPGDTILWIPGYYGLTLAFKKRVSAFVNGSFFDQFIILMVILNTVSLGMENINREKYQAKRDQANLVFTWIFIVEMLLKLYVMGVKEYVRDTMCLFDGVIVATSVMDLISSS